MLEVPSDKVQRVFFALDENQRPIGTLFIAYTIKPDNQKMNEIWIYISTLKAHQRKGIGKSLLTLEQKEAEKMGVGKINSYVENPESLGFAQKFGGAISAEKNMKYLLLREANYNKAQEWITHLSAKNNDICLKFFEKIPDELMDKFIDAFNVMNRDNPDVAQGLMEYEPWEAKQFREAEEKAEKRGLKRFTILTFNKDENIVGLTMIKTENSMPASIMQSLTGTVRSHRGRGLAKLLKAEMLMHIKSNLPGFVVVTTWNNKRNKAMNHINSELGYKDAQPCFDCQLEVTSLGKLFDL
jgi:GNAT superfamily N-acetyltransferase